MQLLRPTQGGYLRLLLLCAVGLLTMASPSLAGPPRGGSGSGDGEPVGSSANGRRPASTENQRLLLAELRPHRKKGGRAGEEDPNDYLQVLVPGSSSRAHRKSAMAEMPLDKLSPEKQEEVREILKSHSFYRRLPTLAMEVDHRTYLHLIGHPNVTVAIWRAMKISKVELWETGRDHYEANTGDGTTGTIEVLHRSAERHLVLCDGEYKSPLMVQPIAAKSLVMLVTSYSRDADGKHFVTHRADMFVQFPSQTMDTVARILSPLTDKMTDRSFSEVSVFLRLMSVAMARRPDWVESIARKLEGVAEERKEQLVTLAAHVYADVQKRSLGEISRQNSGGRATVSNGENATGVPRISSQPPLNPQR